MTKADLVSQVYAKAKKGDFANRTACERGVNAVIDSIMEALASGDKVQLVGFGSFTVHERKAHMGRNPQTNEPMEIGSTMAVSFHPGKMLKERVNQK